jgi:2-iminobutanoate/2-iminopropanoate deaminase
MSKRKVTALSAAGGTSAGRLVEIDGMIYSSGINGAAPANGSLPSGAAQQVEAAFANLKRLLTQAGVSLDELGLVSVNIADAAHQRLAENAWITLFPDASGRPAFKINEYELPPGELIQIQVIGVRGQKRKRIEVPGLTTAQAFGVRLGDVVLSAPIDGTDPGTGKRSEDRKTQISQAFRNMEALVRQAGGGKSDLIHVYLFIRGRDDQQDMLDVWLEEFPTDGDRPARKTIFDETIIREAKIIHLMCIAVIGKGKRTNLEAPGISKRHPAPMGCRIGKIVIASGVGGDDPSGKQKSREPDVCSTFAFQNLRNLLEAAGGSLADVGSVSITVNTYDDEAIILKEWNKVFPDAANAPACHFMAFGGRGSYPVQLHVMAALEQK